MPLSMLINGSLKFELPILFTLICCRCAGTDELTSRELPVYFLTSINSSTIRQYFLLKKTT